MTKTIQICDMCKKEVNLLYKVPFIKVEDFIVKIKDSNKELCECCMADWCNYVNLYYFTEREE